jgi:putative heme-binding domain-containing protein
MPPHKFDATEVTGMVAFIRSLRDINVTAAVKGDAQRGKVLYEGKGECTGCHRIRGQGSRFGPDLTEIGAVRPADIVEKSLVDPTAAMLPMLRSVRAVTRDGKTITGRRLNEDTYSVQLIDRQEHLLSLNKAELKEYEVLKTSAMPTYRDKLTDSERADLLAYLLSLKGGN